MKATFLIGYMGSGKTTVGKELSKKYKLPVIDTDEKIIEKMGMSINDIFEQLGESSFRKIESEILLSLKDESCIVTTGGGIILNEKNRHFLRENGRVIFLYCDPDEIFRRLRDDKTRPLLKGNKEEVLYKIYEERLQLYKDTAHYTIDTTNKDLSTIVEEIYNSLNKE